MNEYLHTINSKQLSFLDTKAKKQATANLEAGKVIYFPDYFFKPTAIEEGLLCESILDSKHKNISYHHTSQRLAGCAKLESTALTQAFMHRFAHFARALVDSTLPQYTQELRWGRTSYRPAEIKGRASSKRKDDKRVHVDSFAASPVNGLRILRVFCNINPYGEPRVWHVGEPFTKVLNAFEPTIPAFSATRAKLLQLVRVTKTRRSPYDHYMLHLHDKMKLDDNYQSILKKQRIDFPAQSTWLVFTDHVSHAALSGQYLLEQTFYLPVTAMLNQQMSPLRILEKRKGCVLS